MQISATQKLQFQLRTARAAGEPAILPPRARWRDGVPLWAEIVYCSVAEAATLRGAAAWMHLLAEQPPTIGLLVTPEFEQHGQRLALDIETEGYGGLIRFEDVLTEDNFLRVLVGQGLYPLIVRESELKHFWTQLTLQCERHFLTIANHEHCYGYWESDLALSRAIDP